MLDPVEVTHPVSFPRILLAGAEVHPGAAVADLDQLALGEIRRDIVGGADQEERRTSLLQEAGRPLVDPAEDRVLCPALRPFRLLDDPIATLAQA